MAEIGKLPLPPTGRESNVAKPAAVKTQNTTTIGPVIPKSSSEEKLSLNDKILNVLNQDKFTKAIVDITKKNNAENARNLVTAIGETLFIPNTTEKPISIFKNTENAQSHIKAYTEDPSKKSWKLEVPTNITAVQSNIQTIKQESKTNIVSVKAESKADITAYKTVYNNQIKKLDTNVKTMQDRIKEMEKGLKVLEENVNYRQEQHSKINDNVSENRLEIAKDSLASAQKELAELKASLEVEEATLEKIKESEKRKLKELKNEEKQKLKEERESRKQKLKEERKANPIPSIDKFNYGMDSVLNGLKKLVGDGHLKLSKEYHQDVAAQAGVADVSNLFGLVGDGHNPKAATAEQVKEAWKAIGENELAQLAQFGKNYVKDLTSSMINNLTFGLFSGKKQSYTPDEFLKHQIPKKSLDKSLYSIPEINQNKNKLESMSFEGQPVKAFLSFGGGFEFAQRVAIVNYRETAQDITSAFFKVIANDIKYLQPYQFLLVEKRLKNGVGNWESKNYRIESFDVPFVSGDSSEVTYGALNTKLKNPWNTTKYYCNIHVSADYKLQNFLDFCKKTGLGVQTPITKNEEDTESFSLNIKLPGNKNYKIEPSSNATKIDFNIATLGEDKDAGIKTSYVLKIINDRTIRNEALVQTLTPSTMELAKGEKGWNLFDTKYDKQTYKNKETYLGFENFKIINVEPDKFELKSNVDNSKPVYGFTITVSWTKMYFIDPWSEDEKLNFKEFNSYELEKALYIHTVIKPVAEKDTEVSSTENTDVQKQTPIVNWLR